MITKIIFMIVLLAPACSHKDHAFKPCPANGGSCPKEGHGPCPFCDSV